jgi:putative transposase
MTTDDGEASQIITGRALRSIKQLRNKRHSNLNRLISRCKKGSRRWKKLTRRKCEASAKSYRQQRNILHKASRQAMRFCQAQKIAVLAVGDVGEIGDGVELGRHTNQKISQWSHGILVSYLCYKLAGVGIALWQIAEDYSTRTCSNKHLNPKAPKGRNFTCTGCGASLHRDINGAANITSRAKYGRYSLVHCASKN